MTIIASGFYRITINGMRGIGVCRHETPRLGERTPYERWALMFLRPDLTGENASFTSLSREPGEITPDFVVGKRIRGLAAPKVTK